MAALGKELRKMAEVLYPEQYGNGKHEKRRDAQGHILTLPKTPSDRRVGLNIKKVIAMHQGTTIHGLAEVIAARSKEQHQRRLQRTAEPVPVVPSCALRNTEVVLPVVLEPEMSDRELRLLEKREDKERRLLRRWEAEEAEHKRQRSLLLPLFTKVLKMGHDLLSRDIEKAGGLRAVVDSGKYTDFTINACADMNAALRMQGFAKSRLLVADYTVEGDARGSTFVIEVCGYFLEPIFESLEEKPRWVVPVEYEDERCELVCECYHEMRLTHNKEYTQYRVSAEWFCDRCRTKGKPDHKVGNTLLCKKCFKDDPSEVVAEFMDRYENAEERAAAGA